MEDSELLRQYLEHGSETAFTELVKRYIDFVYSTARRQVIEVQLAEEVTQTVFCLLARKASGLTGYRTLAGWLYRTTYFTAAKTLRTETRRHKREQEVAKMNQDNLYADTIWESLSPMLNESLNQLDEKDRLVILLRFFQHKPMQEVGETMGISEAAAKMRVSRAIEELREFFSKRNVICSGGVLSAMLTEKAIEAAPVTLMQNVLTAVSSSATASTIIVSVFGKVLVAGGAVVAVALGIGIYVHTVELTASRRSQVFNSYAATGVGNQPGSSSQSAAFAVLNSAANFVDNPKLDKAIADLRAALHSRPKSHDLYDVGLITNAIQEFGNNQQDQRVAFGVLQETVGDSERFVRAGSIFGIGYLGKSLPEASPFLWNLLYSASASDPWNKFEALRKIGFRIWDMPQLTVLLGDPISDGGILTELVPEAITGLIQNNPVAAKPYLSVIEDLLDDPNPDTRFRAALALIKSEGANNPKIFSALHALFQRPNNHHNEYYKFLAAKTLGNSGPSARPLVPDMLEFAKSASEISVQEAVYDAIAEIEPDLGAQNPEVAKALEERQDDQMWAQKWKSGSYALDGLRAALRNQRQALTAANHLAQIGAEAKDAVPDMIRALWGKDEDTRNAILADIYKVDPQALVRKINMATIITGNVHEVLDHEPNTQQNKLLKQDLITLELFSGWCLPEELAAFTNKLAAQDPEAYRAFVESNKER